MIYGKEEKKSMRWHFISTRPVWMMLSIHEALMVACYGGRLKAGLGRLS